MILLLPNWGRYYPHASPHVSFNLSFVNQIFGSFKEYLTSLGGSIPRVNSCQGHDSPSPPPSLVWVHVGARPSFALAWLVNSLTINFHCVCAHKLPWWLLADLYALTAYHIVHDAIFALASLLDYEFWSCQNCIVCCPNFYLVVSSKSFSASRHCCSDG